MNSVLLIGDSRFTTSLIKQVRGLDTFTVMEAATIEQAVQLIEEALPDVVIIHTDTLGGSTVGELFGEKSQIIFFMVLEEPGKWLTGNQQHSQPVRVPVVPATGQVNEPSAQTIDVLSELYIEKKVRALEGGADVYIWLLLDKDAFSKEAFYSAQDQAAGKSSSPETAPDIPTDVETGITGAAGKTDATQTIVESDEVPLIRLRASQCRLIQAYIHVALSRAQRYRDLSRINDWLSAVALVDALTQLNNRRAFDLELAQQVRNARYKQTYLSLMVLDIDFFKSVNDRHGHLVGDEVLKQMAKRLLNNMRFYDTPFRYGGEEFVVTLGNTGLSEAKVIAERLRQSIAEQPFELAHLLGEPNPISLTVSVGLTELRADDDAQGQSFLHRADQLLLKAKADGRNRVVSQ